MRNFGPKSYAYVPLTIINPFKQEVLTEGNEYYDVEADLIRMDFPGLQCQTNKSSYAPGEGSPAPFYGKLGFVETGEILEGEKVMSLKLTPAEGGFANSCP